MAKRKQAKREDLMMVTHEGKVCWLYKDEDGEKLHRPYKEGDIPFPFGKEWVIFCKEDNTIYYPDRRVDDYGVDDEGEEYPIYGKLCWKRTNPVELLKLNIPLSQNKGNKGSLVTIAKELGFAPSRLENAVAIGTAGECRWYLSEDGTLTVCGKGAMGEFQGHLTWSGTFSFAGVNCERAVIQEGITGICERAFWNVRSLKSVQLPSSVTTIGDRAFSECVNLTHIEIPESVTSIGSCAFSGCERLANVQFGGNSELKLGDKAFYDCLSLKEVKVPKGTIIGDKALGFKHKGEYYWNSCPVENFTVTYQ